VAAHTNLGVCYQHLRNVRKAIEETRRASEILPKRALYHLNLARDEIYAGEFPAAEREVHTALELNPSSEKGILTLAYAQLGQNQLVQAAETYRKLEKTSTTGAVLAALGLADMALYEGRFSEAAQILEKGAAADLAAKRLDDAADKFTALGYTQLQRGQKGRAIAAAESALAASRSVKIRFLAALIYVDADQLSNAKELAASLASERQSEPKAHAKLVEGEMHLNNADMRQAIQAFKEANTLLDTWIGRFELGRAYLADKQFPEADSEFDRCIKRRGEAIELFMDDVPTYGYFPPVHYFLGRVREGSGTTGFAESYRTYLSIRGRAGDDPLLPEVRRRAGQ
jgi:tetratricopeptide (TPR) repeat protein